MRKLWNGVFFLLAAGGIFGIVFLWLPRIFAVAPKVVMSGSMEPGIPVGSLVYISRQIPPETVREQDIISYQLGGEMDVLHRVILKDREKEIFRTKGDANTYADPGIVQFSDYRGKAVGVIPFIGYLIFYLQQGRTPLWLFMGMAGLAAADHLWEKKRERRMVREETI